MTFPQKPDPPTEYDKLRSRRGAKLATRMWKSSNMKEATAILVMVHGGGWQSGYFDPLAQFLIKQHPSLLITTYDQPGLGYSEKEPAAPEGCFHVDTFDWLLDDLFDAVKWAKSEAKTINGGTDISILPVLLLGESFGGIIVFKALLEASVRNETFAGAVSLGGLIKIHPSFMPPRPVVAIMVQLAKCFPRWKTPAVDFSHSFDDAFGNKEWAKIARADEPHIIVSPRPTLGMLAAILTTGDVILEHASEITTPVLAVHGKRDCRCEISNMEEFCSKVKDHKAKLIPVETDGHQLLQDTDNITDRVMGYVSDFVGSQM